MPPALGLLSSASLGRHYELATLAFLKGPPFYLHALLHLGRKSDQGVDLHGKWDVDYSKACAAAAARGEPLPRRSPLAALPLGHELRRNRRRWDTVVQCKRYADRVGPEVVRELEGTIIGQRLTGGPLHTDRKLMPRPVLGILAATSGFTPGALQQAAQSQLPIMLLHLPRVGPPIAAAGEEGAEDEIDEADPEEERYEARRIEVNAALKDVLGDGAYEVVERIALDKARTTKLEWNWLGAA